MPYQAHEFVLASSWITNPCFETQLSLLRFLLLTIYNRWDAQNIASHAHPQFGYRPPFLLKILPIRRVRVDRLRIVSEVN
jgi:hypothetical protein